MPVIENTAVVRAPRDVVFDALVDMRGELAWNPKVELMEKISEGPVGLGTRFRAKWRLSQVLTVECVRFDRPSGWTHVNGGPIEVTLEVDLTDVPEGTQVRTRFTPHPRGVRARLMYPVFLMAIRREERQNVSHYTAWIESGAAPAS